MKGIFLRSIDIIINFLLILFLSFRKISSNFQKKERKKKKNKYDIS